MARELIILPRFKLDFRNARKHAEFDAETLEYVFDALISGEKLPSTLREHRLKSRSKNWSGFTECHLACSAINSARIAAFTRQGPAGATGSIPVPPTIQNKDFARLSWLFPWRIWDISAVPLRRRASQSICYLPLNGICFRHDQELPVQGDTEAL